MKKITFLIVVIVLLSCNEANKSKAYEKEVYEKHQKYRTLWYRTDEQCFYDSCRKYGLLYDSILGIAEADKNLVDTVPVNGPAFCP